MKRGLAAVFLVLLAPPALAAHWVYTRDNSGRIVSVDTEAFERQDVDGVVYWKTFYAVDDSDSRYRIVVSAVECDQGHGIMFHGVGREDYEDWPFELSGQTTVDWLATTLCNLGWRRDIYDEG
jgi:hypothetical protein